jgi:mycofactocin precursor
MEKVEPRPHEPQLGGEPLAALPSVPPAPAAHDADLVESELLIEEVSIDGMCGVY